MVRDPYYLNDFASSTIWAIEIPVSLTKFLKIPKIPEFNMELYSFWSESEIDDSQSDSEFSSDDDKSVKYYTSYSTDGDKIQ